MYTETKQIRFEIRENWDCSTNNLKDIFPPHITPTCNFLFIRISCVTAWHWTLYTLPSLRIIIQIYSFPIFQFSGYDEGRNVIDNTKDKKCYYVVRNSSEIQ